MKLAKSAVRTALSGIFLTALVYISPISISAAETDQAQQMFASPNQAAQALQTAVEANDKAALNKLFGPEMKELSTGDAVQDAHNRKRFASLMLQGYELTKTGEDKIMLEVGPDHWPMPIPLVRVDGQWHFDTAAGKEELINRHIGKDELYAIGVCRLYVTAQQRYAEENPEPGTGAKYARNIHSAPGKKDGLYWPPAENEPASPLGPLVAKAEAEGYVVHAQGTGPHPFHGYYFHILSRQGESAPGGKKSYLSHNKMTGGFALVAYPVIWGQSGIMTFIVNQDGKVYQRNFDENTSQSIQSMTEYNPDSEWTLVRDEGVSIANLDK